MNKKVSTILTLSLLLGGSLLSSSAFAQTVQQDWIDTTPTTDFSATGNNGAQYVIVQNVTVNGTARDLVYGFEEKEDGTLNDLVKLYNRNAFTSVDELKKFAWTIKEEEPASGTFVYTFVNVATGEELRMADHKTWASIDANPNSTANDKFIFSGSKKYSGDNTATGFGQIMFTSSKEINNQWSWGALDLKGDSLAIYATDYAGAVSASGAQSLKFYKINSEIIVGDDNTEKLNGLYNKKGFNFDVETPTGVTVENLFGPTNKQVKAIYVDNTVKAAGDQDYGFPKGTYFTVARPAGEEFNNDWSEEKKYNYLKECTFIAVSSTNCAEVTPGARETGEGFQLIEIAGSSNTLNMYYGTAVAKQTKDAQVSIWNACFEVEANLSDYPFSLDLKNFRYLKKESADNTGEHGKAEVALQVINYASNSYALATKPSSNQFVFKYSQSSIASVFDFLEEGRTAAVYNIQFVSGDDDESENGKYLTFGTLNNSDHVWVAKGEALAQSVLNTPAYQFVITKADAKTNEITFTNRESGRSFTTQLFKDGETNGTPYYSMATTNSAEEFEIANVNLNNYEVTVDEDETVKFNDAQIILTKSTVDKYAGFLNEEEGKMVTLNFGRDVNNTSNRLYAYVGDNNYMIAQGTNYALVSPEVSDAALWKLIRVEENKEDKELKFERSYVYELNGTVQVEPFGDVVAMPVYKLEYINDAEETDTYLAQRSYTAYEVNSAGTEFIVRLNADGSVDLMGLGSVETDATSGGEDDFVRMYSSSYGLEHVSADNYKYNAQYTYAIEESATAIKTYLGETSPIVSWPAEEGHVSIQSENGNYISMNEDRDGIVVANEAEVYYLHVTDKDAIVPSFYISRGMGEGSTAESERLFLFNPVDSAKYYVGPGEYNRLYSWDEDRDKALFKTGIMNATRDTLTLTVKGEADKKVAMKADNKNTWGGLNRFKFQIIETEDGDGYYYIRQTKAGRDGNENETMYLSNIGDKLTWTTEGASSIERLVLSVDEEAAPTANESVSATEVKVVAYDGAINIKNAAGKNVVVSTILGQIVANEVLTSDNATISVPAGIAIVSVDGEEAVKVSVR